MTVGLSVWRSAIRTTTSKSSSAFRSRPPPLLRPWAKISRGAHHHTSLNVYRMASTLPRLPVFEAISSHDPDSTAVVHSASQRIFKYGELLGDVCRVRNQLYEASGKSDLNGERVAFLVENSYDYVGKPLSKSRCRKYKSSKTTDHLTSNPSHMASRPRSTGNSRTPIPSIPSARAAVHPGPQRGTTALVNRQMHTQGKRDPGHESGV